MSISEARELLEAGVICHDYKKLCIACYPYDISPVCIFDTMTAAYLISPGESSYPVSKLALRYLSATATEDGEEWYCRLMYPVLLEELEKVFAPNDEKEPSGLSEIQAAAEGEVCEKAKQDFDKINDELCADS